MSKATPFATNLLKLLETNVAYANVGDAGGLQPSASAGNEYISLHTGDPGLTGDQTINEANYTGYARVPVARSGAGWTVAAGGKTNAANITFGLCTLGTNLITHFGIGTASAGAGQLLYSFALVPQWFACHGELTNNQIHQNTGFSANDPVAFMATVGSALPTPIVAGTIYFVKTIISADLFTISTTLGGATLNITVDGFGLVGKIAALNVTPGITPQFIAGQLSVTET